MFCGSSELSTRRPPPTLGRRVLTLSPCPYPYPFRHEVEAGTDIGKIAKEYMDRGDLVPDQARTDEADR